MIYNPVFFFGVLIIIIGLAIELMGWKIHQQIVGVSGVIVGFVVGDFVGGAILNLDLLPWRTALIAASTIAFFILFFVYIRASIAVTSGIVGALIVSGFTSSRTITEWSLNYAVFQTNYNYPLLFVAFAVSSIAGYRFYKLGYIILSTGIGSILVAYGGNIAGLWGYDHLGIFLLLSLMLGAIVQFSEEGIIRERRLQAQKFKFCPKCGRPISIDTMTCTKCENKISSE